MQKTEPRSSGGGKGRDLELADGRKGDTKRRLSHQREQIAG